VQYGGQQVQLVLTARKFFSGVPDCLCKIFTEHFPDPVQSWVRMTTRLSQAITSIGLATDGHLGARLAARLGIQTSRIIVLRRC